MQLRPPHGLGPFVHQKERKPHPKDRCNQPSQPHAKGQNSYPIGSGGPHNSRPKSEVAQHGRSAENVNSRISYRRAVARPR